MNLLSKTVADFDPYNPTLSLELDTVNLDSIDSGGSGQHTNVHWWMRRGEENRRRGRPRNVFDT